MDKILEEPIRISSRPPVHNKFNPVVELKGLINLEIYKSHTLTIMLTGFTDHALY